MASATVNDVVIKTGETTHLQELDTTGTSKASVTLVVSSITASTTLNGFVQGSNDSGNWFDLSGSADVSLSAVDKDDKVGLVIGGYQRLRMRWTYSGTGTAVFSSTLSTSL